MWVTERSVKIACVSCKAAVGNSLFTLTELPCHRGHEITRNFHRKHEYGLRKIFTMFGTKTCVQCPNLMGTNNNKDRRSYLGLEPHRTQLSKIFFEYTACLPCINFFFFVSKLSEKGQGRWSS